MSKSLLVTAMCIALFASCKDDSTECSTEEQQLRQELTLRDQRIRNLEDSLRMAQNGNAGQGGNMTASLNSGAGSNARMPGAERSMYKEGVNRVARISVAHGRYPGQFPEGSERLLATKDVEFLSQWGRTMMLTEIYARHGMRFTDEDVQTHYNRQSWYHGNSRNVTSRLSRVERANVAFIQNYESTIPKQ